MATAPKPLLDSPNEIEAQFYEAMQSADIDRMMAVWSDDDEIFCVHPGGGRLVGAAAIRASFEALFANGPIDAVPQRVRRLQHDGCAVHSVLERVRAQTEQGLRSGYATATNVYVKTALGWRLASHHASPGSPIDAEDDDGPATIH